MTTINVRVVELCWVRGFEGYGLKSDIGIGKPDAIGCVKAIRNWLS